jgi:type VI secretion system Hcp family effector
MKTAFDISISAPGRNLNSKGGQLLAMAYGMMAITPRNLHQALSRMQSESSGNTGQMIGKRQHNPLTITKSVGSASPQLMNAHWKQEVMTTVVIEIVGRPDTGAGEVVIERITLTNASIANYKTFHGFQAPPTRHPGSGSMSVHNNELEQFDLTFQKITVISLFTSKSASDNWTA